jgi:hypothetical protein
MKRESAKKPAALTADEVVALGWWRELLQQLIDADAEARRVN